MVLTPIKTYYLKNRPIYVKRDDLVGDGVNLPRWSKIEGIRQILKSEAVDKNKPLTHLTVYGSWTGWVLSTLCKEEGIEFISSYPDSKTFPKFLINKVLENGGKLNPLRPNLLAVMENKLISDAKRNGWQMLPYAFNHPMYINHMAERMRQTLSENQYDHLIIPMGSGVTASGLIREFLKYDSWKDILNNKRQVHSITMSSIKSTRTILQQNHVDDVNNVHIYKSPFAFDDMMSDYEVPFDCNEFWEKKMWYWLEQNADKLDGKILFWNIGGSFVNSISQ